MTAQYYGTPADADWVLRTFATPRRRRLLDVLRTVDGALHREFLAEALVVEDEILGASPDSLDERIRNTEIVLHHNLLPKLEEVGVLTYDAASGRIEDVTLDDDREATTFDR